MSSEQLRMTDHVDHWTGGRQAPWGAWVAMIAMPQRAFDGRMWGVATAWVDGMVAGGSPMMATPRAAFDAAFDDTVASLRRVVCCAVCGHTSTVEVCDPCQQFADELADGEWVTILDGVEVTA